MPEAENSANKQTVELPMNTSRPYGIDGRYPTAPKEVRTFLLGYPVVMVAGMMLGLSGYSWFWWLAAFCAIGWVAGVCTFLAGELRREGYRAAMEDVEHRKTFDEYFQRKGTPEKS